jgi:hypothetical protein
MKHRAHRTQGPQQIQKTLLQANAPILLSAFDARFPALLLAEGLAIVVYELV